MGSVDFAIVRYNSDLTLDPSFGTGGIVTTDFSGGVDHAEAVTIQANGIAPTAMNCGSLPKTV